MRDLPELRIQQVFVAPAKKSEEQAMAKSDNAVLPPLVPLP